MLRRFAFPVLATSLVPLAAGAPACMPPPTVPPTVKTESPSASAALSAVSVAGASCPPPFSSSSRGCVVPPQPQCNPRNNSNNLCLTQRRMAASLAGVGPKGPIAEERPHIVRYGKVDGENRGEAPMDPPLERDDPLFWLRDDTREKAEVLDWLRVEAAYLKDKTSATLDAPAAKIYDEHISRIKETDPTAPRRYGAWLYYERTIQGQSYKLYCRRPVPPAGTDLATLIPDEPGKDAEEEVLLNVNELAEGKTQCNIASLSVSPSHTRVAFTVDMKGDEVYQLRFLKYDASTKKWCPCTDDIVGVTDVPLDGDVAWGLDDAVLFYHDGVP